MNLNHIISDKSQFSERIISEIQKLPFGTLPKSELELIILDAIIRSIEPIDSYTNINKHFNALKSELKLSQTQLKNKLLAAQLRFDSKTDNDVENYILKAILDEKYLVDGNYIVISIFNPLLNDQAKSYFETRELILDTSFNKSILKINLNGFIQFILKLSTISDKHKLAFKKILNDAQDEGLLQMPNEGSKRTLIEDVESITGIGVNLIEIIKSISPFLINLL
jgi:hypothetical protein